MPSDAGGAPDRFRALSPLSQQHNARLWLAQLVSSPLPDYSFERLIANGALLSSVGALLDSLVHGGSSHQREAVLPSLPVPDLETPGRASEAADLFLRCCRSLGLQPRDTCAAVDIVHPSGPDRLSKVCETLFLLHLVCRDHGVPLPPFPLVYIPSPNAKLQGRSGRIPPLFLRDDTLASPAGPRLAAHEPPTLFEDRDSAPEAPAPCEQIRSAPRDSPDEALLPGRIGTYDASPSEPASPVPARGRLPPYSPGVIGCAVLLCVGMVLRTTWPRKNDRRHVVKALPPAPGGVEVVWRRKTSVSPKKPLTC